MLSRGLAILRQLGAEEELGLALSFAFQRGVVENAAEAEKLLHESLAIHEKLGRRWEVAFSLLQFSWSASVHWPGQVDAEPYVQESYAISSEIGDRWGAASSLQILAECLHCSGGYQEAKQRLWESLVVLREIGDGQAVQHCLDRIGYLSRELGQYEEAQQLHRESLEIASDVGDRLGVAGSLDNLGLVAYDVGDYERAEDYFEQGLAIRRRLERKWETGSSLQHVGDVAMARGDYQEALRRYQDSLDLADDFYWLQVDAFWRLGEVFSAMGDFQQARQHFRAALELEMAGQNTYIPLVFEVLVAVAQFAARMGKKEMSVEWLAYIADHAASNAQTRDKAKRLLDELASALPPQAMAAARERHSDRALDEVVQAVLQELGP